MKMDASNVYSQPNPTLTNKINHELNKDQHDLSVNDIPSEVSKPKNDEKVENPKNDDKKKTPMKGFQHRESLMTEFLKNKHFRALRNFIHASFIYFYCQCWLTDILDGQSENKKESQVYSNLSSLTFALVKYWLPMMFASLVGVYYGFRKWTEMRRSMSPALADKAFLGLFVIYLMAILFIPAFSMHDIGNTSKYMILLEQIRMMMKSYAFVRSNAPKVLYAKLKDEDNDEMNNDQRIPEFSHYAYFMFAPTLIYSDEYPRTTHVQWGVVAGLCVEISAAMIAYSYIVERICIPYFINFHYGQLTFLRFLRSVLITSIPSVLIFFLWFYAFIDRWMNLWAELLRFGDRQFYQDWWNASSPAEFLRDWNLIVQNWIYIYLFRDLNKMLNRRSKLAGLLTIEISAVFHDYIMSKIMGSFSPIFLISFTIIPLLKNISIGANQTVNNTLFYMGMFLMISTVLSYPSMELVVRSYDKLGFCPQKHDDNYDYWLPRIIQCSNRN